MAGLDLCRAQRGHQPFSTLPPRYRTDAASLFSLVRNVGSSIGISVCATLLARNTQISHAELVGHVTPFVQGLSPEVPAGQVRALAKLNQEVTDQASFIAYLDDFLFMMWVTLAALPLILLLKYRKVPAAATPHAAME